MVNSFFVIFFVSCLSLTSARRFLVPTKCTDAEVRSMRTNYTQLGNKCIEALELDDIETFLYVTPEDQTSEKVHAACQKSTQYQDCLKSMFNYIDDRCYNETGIKDGEFLKKMAARIIEYACSENGSKLIAFGSNAGFSCFMKNYDNIGKCTYNKFQEMDKKSKDSNSSESNETEHKKPEYEPILKCSDLSVFNNCIIDNMKTCEGGSDFLLALLKYVTECE